jgi:hypothetical protein
MLAAALALTLAAPAAAAEPVQEPLVDQVRAAIDRGVRYLKDKEDGKGNWETDAFATLSPGGPSSLALLALLNAGVKPDDPVVQRGLRYLRTLPPRHTYTVGLQTMVFAEAGQSEDKERIQRNVNWLIDARILDGGRLSGWGYYQGDVGRGDNSNTQYALLGLHAGKTAGADIKREVWQSILEFYQRTQRPSGGWNYKPNQAADAERLTMTTAGLCGLLIAGMELNDGREKFLADGSAQGCGAYAENKPVALAMKWLGDNLKIREQRGHYFYNLYGIERAGRLSGQRFFGPYDWYRRGCEDLVEKQQGDGSWFLSTGSPDDRSSIVGTSFALLFLSKGRTPVLISKLVHHPVDSPDLDWNNDRHDARNLVEYASKELFKRQPLAWQIFNARQASVDNRQEFLTLVSDLLQSPIVYFNGHKSLKGPDRLSAVEKEMLREYVNQGGFILAEACCGSRDFDRSFRALMNELFPQAPLRPLANEHPLWSAHALVPPNREFKLEGIDMGCKTVVVYSPQDLSCLWESNQYADAAFQNGRGVMAFRLAGNIIAYATGLELPRPKLTRQVVHDDKDVPRTVRRGFLKVCQLRHDGDWQPAPRAMRNLMLHLRETVHLDVQLVTEELRPSHPDLYNFKFLYMHGRNDFTYDDPREIENLRANLNTGGLLFADACCGKKAFDQAFRDFVKKLYPDRTLEPIPLTDELYGAELNGTAISTVRCRRDGPDGKPDAELRAVAPYLEGIKHQGRWVVIYSKYDIGCALEKHQSPNCLGHDHDSALKLGSAVVLYALKR